MYTKNNFFARMVIRCNGPEITQKFSHKSNHSNLNLHLLQLSWHGGGSQCKVELCIHTYIYILYDIIIFNHRYIYIYYIDIKL